MRLTALAAFTDNYIWMVDDGERAVVVDPGDAAPVLGALEKTGLTLCGILLTHHHDDHVGGVDALRSRLRGSVWGPAGENIPQPFVALREGDHVELLDTQLEVLDVPGHTAGHIAFLGQGQSPLLFCGDTLFSAGCGRLFEGSAAQMSNSLGKLAALPASTSVCCAHEYTLANLAFAAAVEPSNKARAEHQARCGALREQGLPTLPSTLGLELQINPFLRCAQPTVIAAARAHGAAGEDAVSVFSALRQWKDNHR